MALRTPFANDTKTYGFEFLRGMLEASLQEGVLNWGGGGGDLMVTQRGAGANMSVDVAAGAGVVKGDSGIAALGLTQGLFLVVNDAAVNVVVPAADATFPTVHQLVLKVEDSSDLGSVADQATFVVVAGTAAAGATLDNRTGAAALPSNCMRLADILVPAASSSVSNSSIRDRRPWARGACYTIVRNANAAAGSHYTTSSTAFGAIDATNLAPRIEYSGVPVTVTLSASVQNSLAANDTLFEIRDGSTELNGGAPFLVGEAAANNNSAFSLAWTIPAPAAGSHKFTPYWKVSGGTATLLAAASIPLQMVVREDVRQNQHNASVTTG